MNNLLIFFALPIATIIISIALQKILKCPYLVSAIVFAIFLIFTFIINNLNFLVATIVYTIISFITALIVCLACRIIESLNERKGCNRNCRRNNNTVSEIENINDILSINGEYTNNGNNGVITVNALNNSSNNGCNCNSNNNRVSARINVIPNSNTNGRTGCLCGNYNKNKIK